MTPWRPQQSTYEHAAPIGGLIAVVLLLLFIGQGLVTSTASYTLESFYYGSGGMHNTALFAPNKNSFHRDLLIPKILAPARPGKATITGTMRDAGKAADELSAATKAIEDEGYKVGYMLTDLTTGITVSYNADMAFYSASSIKGPYVVSLVEYELGDAYLQESNRITNIIEWSDNMSYSSLRGAYGSSCFATLVQASGADAIATTVHTSDINYALGGVSLDSIADNNYEFVSANQLVALWRECHSFLSSGSEAAVWLGEIFETPENSAIRSTASSIGTTWSKAGWYPEDATGWGTTVDAGIVCTTTGDFVLCVMTSAPEDFAAVESIVSPLVTVRGTLCN